MPTAKTLRTAQDLVAAGLVTVNEGERLAPVIARYAMAITPAMAQLMDAPAIASQFLPDRRELIAGPDETADPIGDERHEVLPGVVHRYPDRVLFKLTHACPVYCRFCFRREMVGPGGDTMLKGDRLDRAVAYVAERPAIFEVILTGGDPLILDPDRIRDITERLARLPHVASLRWHTRVPVVDPERITPELVKALRAGGPDQAVYIGLHTNHVQELTPSARAAIARLVDSGLVLASQTVLLKGINDNASALETLFRALVSLRVRPYYLHHPDRAPGTSHFRVSIAEGQALMAQLRGRLSGLALPTYVLDIPGGVAKVPVGPSYLDGDHVRDPIGTRHKLAERG
jgi:lysine 2,3-aminomutase